MSLGLIIGRLIIAVLAVHIAVGCAATEEIPQPSKAPDTHLPPVKEVIDKPLPPEKAGELAGKVGENWLYGQGVGETALAAGAIYVFPPYAIYVLGNAALSACGYEQLRVTDALPEEPREEYNSVYDSVTSAPGHVAATAAGTDFRTREIIKKDYEEFFKGEYKDADRSSNKAGPRGSEKGSREPHSVG